MEKKMMCETRAAVVRRAETLLASIERDLLRMESLLKTTVRLLPRGGITPATKEGLARLLEEIRSDLGSWARMQAEAEQAALTWEERAQRALQADDEDLAREAVSRQLEWGGEARRHGVQRRIAEAYVELVEAALAALESAGANQPPCAGAGP